MPLTATLDDLLQGAVTAGDVPGVAAIATDRDGNTYEGAFGERALGGGVAMTTDTVCWIASMTKAVAAAAVMQQVERGNLDLDAPAGDLIPYLAEVEVLEGFDGAGQPITRPAKGQITLRHLLTHTAGFAYNIWHPEVARHLEVTGKPTITSGEMAALRIPLIADPGSQWNYSIAIDWACQMLEEVTGQRLRDYLAEQVLRPLGMASTGFLIGAEMRKRLATVHQRQADDSLDPRPQIVVRQDPEFDGGGGGLYSTVEDYSKFIRMILNQGEGSGRQILKPETVAMMSTNQMGACRVSLLRTTNADMSLDAEFFPGIEKTWGLSFMINEEQAPTGRSAGSLAWAGLTNCYNWIDPVRGVGGVYMTQILPFVDKKSLPLFEQFETAVYENLNR